MALLLLAGCPESGSQCPAELRAGDPCEIEGLVCEFPGAECDEKPECTCANQPGGLYWDCSKVPYCKCTCFCGKIAINTCESLGCAKKAEEPCPAKAAPVCAVICQDAGPPEAGPDLPGPDLPGPDLPVDLGPPDLPAPDLPLSSDLAPPDLPLPDAPPGDAFSTPDALSPD